MSIDESTILASVFANAGAAMCLLDANDRVLHVNAEWLTSARRTKEDAVGAVVWDLFDDARPEFRRLVREVRASRTARTVPPVSFTRRGVTVWFETKIVPVEMEGGVGLLVSSTNVTERVLAVRALEESELRFRQLVGTIDDVFWMTDCEKNELIYVSATYEKVSGRTCASLYARPRDWLDAVHPEDRARVLDAALTKQVLGTYDEEYRIVRPDGEVRWLRDRAFPVRDESGRVYRVAGTARDVTRQRELEAQLLHTQKMDSIGRLAGGVAHDFNNLLTVIAGNCDSLAEELPPTGESAAHLAEIRDARERAASLTSQLLAFSRREVVAPTLVDLRAVIESAETMLRRIIGEDIVLALRLAPEPTWIKADPNAFGQILLNLAVNARAAMPRGGTLTIESRVLLLDEASAATRPPLRGGPHVELTVRDDGHGMSKEEKSRVFEPFFTTKTAGVGTGLGLAVVHGIVASSGGHIDVESERSSGTTFRICVPREIATRGGSVAKRDAPESAGTETILLVDDDDGVRRVATRALARVGYRVLEASSGAAALAIARDPALRIDLLFTDVVMPQMDGRALSIALRRERPSVRVLFTSGYTDDEMVRYGIEHADVPFLRKPYDLASLRAKVRETLDSEAAVHLP